MCLNKCSLLGTPSGFSNDNSFPIKEGTMAVVTLFISQLLQPFYSEAKPATNNFQKPLDHIKLKL